MNRKRFAAILMTLCMCLSFVGAGWFDGAKVTVDTQNNKVYQYRTADGIHTINGIRGPK
jgi:hypothetical protein